MEKLIINTKKTNYNVTKLYNDSQHNIINSTLDLNKYKFLQYV